MDQVLNKEYFKIEILSLDKQINPSLHLGKINLAPSFFAIKISNGMEGFFSCFF